MTPWIVALLAVVVVIVVVVALRRRRSPDTVRSFQRQIDALSPEARRPVVDQVQRLEHDDEPRNRLGSVRPTPPVTPPTDPDGPDASEATGDAAEGDEPADSDDEGGSRGT